MMKTDVSDDHLTVTQLFVLSFKMYKSKHYFVVK